MRLEGAIGLRVNGQNALEARFNGQIVWADVPVLVTVTGGTEIDVVIGGDDYRLHVFTENGTLEVSDDLEMNYLLVGGGGSGGGAGSSTAGGGGAGGLLTGSALVTAGAYNVVVGAGGAAISGSSNNGNNGLSSEALGLAAVGGGFGSRFLNSGGDGGSGGGGGADGGIGRSGGDGTAGQGFGGGRGDSGSTNNNAAGGGGGGAGSVGADGISAGAGGGGGHGGVGADMSATFGTAVGDDGWFAGGGGGSAHNTTAGTGGQGGGGQGGQSGTGAAGMAGTGGGGGGESNNGGSGAGGSGVVIFRYPLNANPVTVPDGETFTTAESGVVSQLWMGEATDDTLRASAVVTGEPSSVRLAVCESIVFDQGKLGPAEAPGSFDVVKLDIETLLPGTTYYVALEVDGVVDTTAIGKMRTMDAEAGVPQNFQFGSASCSNFSSRVVFDFIHTSNPNMRFFMHTGDLHYDDINVNDEAVYQQSFANKLNAPRIANWFKAMPIPYIWDDHDYATNNSGSEAISRPAALAAFRRRVPTPALEAPGTTVEDAVYYSFKRGRVCFIVTDLRSQRSNKSVVPEGPDRTMMGAQQKAWFKSVIEDQANEGYLFCWVNTVPWIGTPSSSGDFWNGYSTERVELATFFRDAGVVDRLFILSGDMHALTHDDGTNSDYADGGGAPLWVFHCAPLAQSNSVKGGPYSAPIIQEQSLYGVFDVVDPGGSTITLNFSGRYVSEGSQSETEVQTATASFTVT